MQKLQIIGKKFNRLTVIKEELERTNSGKVQFLCKCDCGNFITTVGSKLVSNHTKSCNCLQKEAAKETSKGSITHNKSKNRIYTIWASMKAQCYNEKNEAYCRYGGRGIIVCDRWKNSFKLFLEDMGEGTKGLSIDRINNDEIYEPNNCKWSTQVEQENNKSTNRYMFYSKSRKKALRKSQKRN